MFTMEIRTYRTVVSRQHGHAEACEGNNHVLLTVEHHQLSCIEGCVREVVLTCSSGLSRIISYRWKSVATFKINSMNARFLPIHAL